MKLSVWTPFEVWPLFLAALFTGCAALNGPPCDSTPRGFSAVQPASSDPPDQPVSTHSLVPATRAGQEMSSCQSSRERPPFTEMKELSVDALVEQVLARNPSLTQMTAAWQAASARYPQVSALDDPMVGAAIAPASIGSNNVEFGYRLEVSQKLPFSGKLGLRGESAQAEAAAASNEVDDMRLQLIESARSRFYEYFLVIRAIAVNEENLRLLKSFREEARTRYEKALVPQQDVSQADVELGRQQERGLTLARMRKVAVARLNTLMHLPPDTPLPPPPARLTLGEPLPAASFLRTQALSQRPDLLAFANRIVADEASLRLAQQESYPDFEVMAAYDTIMGNGPTRDLAAQVGVRMNLPVRKERRHAAIAEAQARIAERRAQLDGRIDQINLQLQEAYEQVVESAQVVRLYENTILPAAERNVADARSAYETARIPFLSLIEAQRNRVGLRDRYYEALANYFRRRATLERAVGGPIHTTRMGGGIAVK